MRNAAEERVLEMKVRSEGKMRLKSKDEETAREVRLRKGCEDCR